MYYGAAMELFKFAEKMRFNPTSGEKAMWDLLKSDALCHYKFRRQHPIATFIADFYSHQLRIVIEIDGGYHLDNIQKEYDNFRDEDMHAMGIIVIRFTNDEVIYYPQIVLTRILASIKLQAQKLNDSQ